MPTQQRKVDVVGVAEDGQVLFSAPLGHGVDPELLTYQHGYVAVRPLDAALNADRVLALRLLVRPAAGTPRPPNRAAGRDASLPKANGAVPERRQRLAAYAVVRSDRGLLATEYSARTAVAGQWGMPGGGLDDGEEPPAAVLREVLEETSQTVVLGELVRVQTSHWIGRSPRGVLEDFHAVRLIYLARCDAPTEPVLVDLGGTTESARWVPLDGWASLRWTRGWRDILKQLLV